MYKVVDHNYPVKKIVVSPNNKFVITASTDNTIKITDLNTGQLLYTLRHGHWVPKHAKERVISSISVSPDSNFLVVKLDFDSNGMVEIFDLHSSKLLYTIRHDKWVMGFAISPDSKLIVTYSPDNTAKITDLSSGKLLHTIKHSASIAELTLSPDGKLVVTGSKDKTVKITEVHSGKLLHSITHDYGIADIAISPDSKLLITVSECDTVAKITDLNTGQLLHTIDGVLSATVSPNNKYLITHSLDPAPQSNTCCVNVDSVKVIDLYSAQPLFTVSRDESHCDRIRLMGISSDSKFMVTCSEEAHAVKITDLNTGKLLHTINYHGNYLNNRLIAISNNSKFIVTISTNNRAEITDLVTGQLLHTINHQAEINAVAISPDSNYVITASSDKTAKILQLNND